MKNLIKSYLEKKQFQNKDMIIFLTDGGKIEINDDREIKNFISDKIKEKVILVCDMS